MPKAAASDADFLPISALQHYLYCPRQCALIHVERQWAENVFTAEGRILHERTDTGGHEIRAGVRIERSVQLRSDQHRLVGVADLVEFHDGGRRVVPVEYKRGRPKAHRADEVQLCAQAMALEEMLDQEVPLGLLFYGKTRRRVSIAINDELRTLTGDVAKAAHLMMTAGQTPPPDYDRRKCGACSLVDICRPRELSRGTSVLDWIERQVEI